MFEVNQWILWEPVPSKNGGKPDKVPCGGRNAFDPANWMSHEQASALSQNIAFVFTENDPYFFIDLDHVLQSDGKWKPIVEEICTRFAGAYTEISYSGDGVHIVAQGVMPQEYGHKNQELGVEIYDRLHTLAITGTAKSGIPNVDHQQALTTACRGYMRTTTPKDPNAYWTVGPVEEWRGPTDDKELVDKVIKSRPSANVLWNGAATVADLWNKNEVALIASYPDGKGGFDASSADMALASHLAFWTGKDCERMERLMRMSKLVRKKWDKHPTYLKEFTILKAATSCNNVYQSPNKKISNNKLRSGIQYLNPTDQLDHFKGCVYVTNTHRVLCANGSMISPEQFKVLYGGYDFSMDSDGLKSTKCAWEVFTRSRAVNFPKVDGVLFRPEAPRGEIITIEGRTYVNSYAPVPVRRVEGDVEPFLTLMNKLFPHDYDRTVMLSYMAACVQYVGTKFQWTPLIQGVEGNGKSFLIRAVMKSVGERVSHLVNPADISNKFNAWLEGKVFIGVEEIFISDRREAIDALKILITNDQIEIQPKGGDQYVGDNRANFILLTNHQDAIRKTSDDRRYAPFFTPQQSYEDIVKCKMDGDYFPKLYDWAKKDGYAIIASYLSKYPISDEMNPAKLLHRAPTTTSTQQAVAASQGMAEQEISNAIEEQRVGFRGGWVSSYMLDELLKDIGKARVITRKKRAEMLNLMGYIRVGRCKLPVPREDASRPVLYVHTSHAAPGDSFSKEYCNAQGYVTL